uniref:Uncharacterized protein n=1 Tax=Megaselia scalaris TaxID=36166 RepID=T1H1A3_MEGSC
MSQCHSVTFTNDNDNYVNGIDKNKKCTSVIYTKLLLVDPELYFPNLGTKPTLEIVVKEICRNRMVDMYSCVGVLIVANNKTACQSLVFGLEVWFWSFNDCQRSVIFGPEEKSFVSGASIG